MSQYTLVDMRDYYERRKANGGRDANATFPGLENDLSHIAIRYWVECNPHVSDLGDYLIIEKGVSPDDVWKLKLDAVAALLNPQVSDVSSDKTKRHSGGRTRDDEEVKQLRAMFKRSRGKRTIMACARELTSNETTAKSLARKYHRHKKEGWTD